MFNFVVGDAVQINPGGKDRDVTPEQLREGIKGVVKEISPTGDCIKLGDNWCSRGYFITLSGCATFLYCKC